MKKNDRPKLEFMSAEDDPAVKRQQAIKRKQQTAQYNADAAEYKRKKAGKAEQQAALSVSDPGDTAEIQADTIAEQVVNNQPADPISQLGTSTIQPKQAGDVPLVSSGFENRLNSTKGGGVSLDEATRTEMEGKMGADFSQAKIHTGSAAGELSQQINAQAFTHGQDIYFNSNQSPSDKKLLAHELVHVGQNGNGTAAGLQTKLYRYEDPNGKKDFQLLETPARVFVSGGPASLLQDASDLSGEEAPLHEFQLLVVTHESDEWYFAKSLGPDAASGYLRKSHVSGPSDFLQQENDASVNESSPLLFTPPASNLGALLEENESADDQLAENNASTETTETPAVIKNQYGFSGPEDSRIDPLVELTVSQKEQYHWDATLALFKSVNIGVGAKTLAQWTRKSLKYGWTEQDAVPNIRTIVVSYLPDSDIPVIEAYSFDDAFGYAWKNFGENRVFHWKRKITGSLVKNRKVGFGSEARRWNANHHKFSEALAEKIYRVSGDKDLYDKSLADKSISENFTDMVKDAQIVLYYKNPEFWSGMLTPETETNITTFLSQDEKTQDKWRVLAHYLHMKKAQHELFWIVWNKVMSQPDVSAMQTKIFSNYQALNSIEDQHTIYVAESTGVPGTAPLAYKGRQDALYQEEKNLKAENESLRQQIQTALSNALKAANHKTDEQVLDEAMKKYSIYARENGWTQTYHVEATEAHTIIPESRDTRGQSSTYVAMNTGPIFVPASPAHDVITDYYEELKGSVLQLEQQLISETIDESINMTVSEDKSSYAPSTGKLSDYDIAFMKQSAEIIGGEAKEFFDRWAIARTMLMAEMVDPLAPMTLETMQTLDDFHIRLSDYVKTYLGGFSNAILSNETTGLGKDKVAYNRDMLRDDILLRNALKNQLDARPDSVSQDLTDSWDQADSYKYAIDKTVSDHYDDKLLSFKYLPVQFVSDEDLASSRNSVGADEQASPDKAPGYTLPAFWAKSGNEYIVRVVVKPGEEQPYYELTGSSIYSALTDLNTHGEFPNGRLHFINEQGGKDQVLVSEHTPASSLLGWLSLGLFALSLVLAPFTAGGSLALNLLVAGSAVAGVASAMMHIYENSKTGTNTGASVFLDIVNAVAMALPGIGALGKLGKIAGLGKFAFLEGSFFIPLTKGVGYGAIGLNAVYFGAEVKHALEQISKMEENTEKQRTKKQEAIDSLIRFSLMTGAMLVLPLFAGKFIEGLKGEPLNESVNPGVKNNTVPENIKVESNTGGKGTVTTQENVLQENITGENVQGTKNTVTTENITTENVTAENVKGGSKGNPNEVLPEENSTQPADEYLAGKETTSTQGVSEITSVEGEVPLREIVEEIPRGTKISDLIKRLRELTKQTGFEYAVVKFKTGPHAGKRMIVSGNENGIRFEPGEIEYVYGHTHPTEAGASSADFEALHILDQSQQTIITENGTFKIRKPGVNEQGELVTQQGDVVGTQTESLEVRSGGEEGFSGVEWKKGKAIWAEGKLSEHYNKHVKAQGEFGDISMNEYHDQMMTFLSEKGPFTEVRIGNIIIKFDPSTLRMLIANAKNRQVLSFYKALPEHTTIDPVTDALNFAKAKTGLGDDQIKYISK